MPTWYVNTDNAPGTGDGLTPETGFATQAELIANVAGPITEPVIIECLAPSGVPDEGGIISYDPGVWTGATSTNFITVNCRDGYSYLIQSPSSYSTHVHFNVQYMVINNLTLEMNYSDTGRPTTLCRGDNTGGYFNGCFFNNISSVRAGLGLTTDPQYGEGLIPVINSMAAGFVTGFGKSSNWRFYYYNCVATDCDNGIDGSGADTVEVINCVFFGNTGNTTIGAAGGSSNNAADSNDPGVPGLVIPDLTAADFVDAVAYDFRLPDSSSKCYDTGADLSSNSILPFDWDLFGTTRPQGNAWDIGYHEFDASAGGPSGSANLNADNATLVAEGFTIPPAIGAATLTAEPATFAGTGGPSVPPRQGIGTFFADPATLDAVGKWGELHDGIVTLSALPATFGAEGAVIPPPAEGVATLIASQAVFEGLGGIQGTGVAHLSALAAELLVLGTNTPPGISGVVQLQADIAQLQADGIQTPPGISGAAALAAAPAILAASGVQAPPGISGVFAGAAQQAILDAVGNVIEEGRARLIAQPATLNAVGDVQQPVFEGLATLTAEPARFEGFGLVIPAAIGEAVLTASPAMLEALGNVAQPVTGEAFLEALAAQLDAEGWVQGTTIDGVATLFAQEAIFFGQSVIPRVGNFYVLVDDYGVFRRKVAARFVRYVEDFGVYRRKK